jgi:hypothetical protein
MSNLAPCIQRYHRTFHPNNRATEQFAILSIKLSFGAAFSKARYFSVSRGSQPYTCFVDSSNFSSEMYLLQVNGSKSSFFLRVVLSFGLGAYD